MHRRQEIASRQTPLSALERKKVFHEAELEQFKAVILQMRQEAFNDLQAIRSALAGVEEDSILLEEYAYFMDRQSRMLTYLDRALERLERGTYGYCLTCGEPIDPERLMIVPHTQLCWGCKTGRSGRTPTPSHRRAA
jgi:DnaK suppressor protein